MFKKINGKLTGVVAATALAMTAAPAAFAGEFADAITDGLDKGEMTLIGVAVLILTAVVVMIRKAGQASKST